MAKHIQSDTRVQNLEFSEPWKHLSTEEKNYAYYLQKASWAGAKMVFHQISYEAPALFLLFQLYFQSKDFQMLEEHAMKAGVTHEQWKKFIAYCGGFYGNMSNYHSFGDMKFVPELTPDVFRKILFSNPEQARAGSLFHQHAEGLYSQVEREVFSIDKPFAQLNFPEQGGTTAYFSPNMKSEDLALVRDFLREQKVDPLNTRAFKKQNGSFEVTVGSIQKGVQELKFRGVDFKLVRGEFAPYLEECNYYIEKALPYCANETQKKMLELYIQHFNNGSIDVHKDSQRQWIKDKKPVVEMNIGWIETYIDPENVRAYFEGWVAVVDKEKSEKFQNLVKNSEVIIPQLPWPKYMEKDHFLAPDFTTLEIICFATNSCPLGINIPNYDDIRDNEGFKNLYLSNSMPSYAISSMQFATAEQMKLLSENTTACYQVHVACHELLGHGVGKLTYRNADGSVMEYTDPITGEKFQSCYEEGETWNGKFGAISSSYEECRADTCGFYLCTLKEVYSLFGFEEEQVPVLLWTNVMNQFRKGVLGLQLYNAETQKWGQAHTQGAYVFSQFIYQNQKSKIVSFEILPDKSDFFIHLDKDLLMTEGRELISKFLLILQTFKTSGCVERANAFYAHYSKVDEYFLEVRSLVIDKKKPRRIELNNNLIRYDEEHIEPICYAESLEAIIHSYQDRYPLTPQLVEQVLSVWNEHKDDLRVPLA